MARRAPAATAPIHQPCHALAPRNCVRVRRCLVSLARSPHNRHGSTREDRTSRRPRWRGCSGSFILCAPQCSPCRSRRLPRHRALHAGSRVRRRSRSRWAASRRRVHDAPSRVSARTRANAPTDSRAWRRRAVRRVSAIGTAPRDFAARGRPRTRPGEPRACHPTFPRSVRSTPIVRCPRSVRATTCAEFSVDRPPTAHARRSRWSAGCPKASAKRPSPSAKSRRRTGPFKTRPRTHRPTRPRAGPARVIRET